MSRTIKISLFPLMSILLFHTSIVKIAYVSNYNSIAMIFGIIILIYLIPKKIIFSKKYANINISLLIFSFIFIFTSFYNKTNIDGSILYIIKVVSLFIFIEYANEKNKIQKLSKIFFLLSFIYLLSTYYLILKDPLLAWKNNLNYLIGTKFSVSYMGISTAVLYFFTYKEKVQKNTIFKIIGLSIICFSMFLASKVSCSTGLIGNVIFLVLLLIPIKNIKKILAKPIVPLIIFIFCCSILMIGYNLFVNIDFIRYIVEDVLNKSLTLTGRMYVYNNIMPYIKEGFFFGYGYNSVYSLFNNVMYIGKDAYALTAQNAILEYWLYSGIFGVINLFVIMYFTLKNNYENTYYEKHNKYYPYLAGLLVLIILGMVEITINMYFFMFLAFLNLGNSKYEKSKEEN